VTLIDDLRARAADEWRAFTHHPFLDGIADGSLPEPAFRVYLAQDYRFLVHFARAYALEAYKSETRADILWGARAVASILDTELTLHIAYCARFGISAADLEAADELPPNVAYTRFVLDTGVAGDTLDLAVAMTPCTVGYGEIALRLAADSRTDMSAANPYAEWIATYAGAAYQEGAAESVARLEDLWQRRGGPARLAGLTALFARAARLEADFWQMALDHQD
jgi:thiaminase (transcriptional activator TenA)